MGEPMKEAPWDLGYRARWIVGRGDGCDLPGCDLPGCDLPGCDLPGCDF